MNYKMTYRNGKNIREHRAIMEDYLDRKLLPVELIHHKDGNKRNNNISNLEIITRSEHAKIHYGNRLLKPIIQKSKSGAVIRQWDCAREVQKYFGFHPANICTCCRHRIKTAYGFIWEYANVGIE